jgi:hypothetical protein
MYQQQQHPYIIDPLVSQMDYVDTKLMGDELSSFPRRSTLGIASATVVKSGSSSNVDCR